MTMNKDNYITVTDRKVVEVDIHLDESLLDDDVTEYRITVNRNTLKTLTSSSFERLIFGMPRGKYRGYLAT